jgi:hypothetical protein
MTRSKSSEVSETRSHHSDQGSDVEPLPSSYFFKGKGKAKDDGSQKEQSIGESGYSRLQEMIDQYKRQDKEAYEAKLEEAELEGEKGLRGKLRRGEDWEREEEDKMSIDKETNYTEEAQETSTAEDPKHPDDSDSESSVSAGELLSQAVQLQKWFDS